MGSGFKSPLSHLWPMRRRVCIFLHCPPATLIPPASLTATRWGWQMTVCWTLDSSHAHAKHSNEEQELCALISELPLVPAVNSGQQEAKQKQNEMTDPMFNLRSCLHQSRCPVFQWTLIAALRKGVDSYLYNEEIEPDTFWGVFQL